MKSGIYTASELSNEQYHAGPGISASGLKTIFKQSPAHYQAQKNESLSKERKAFLNFGTSFHDLVLEPEEFKNRCQLRPEGNANSNVYKAIAKPLIAAGVNLVTKKALDDLHGMRDSVMSHVRAANLVNTGIHEQTVVVEDPETGVLCKVRADCATDFFVADLKSLAPFNAGDFSQAAYKFGYHMQAAFYTDVHGWYTGKKPEYFYFIVTEKEAPYATVVYKASPLFLALGRKHYRAALNAYAKCLASGEWTCYPTETLTLEPPGWALKELDI